MTDTNDTPEVEQPELDFNRSDNGGVSTKVGSLGWPEGADNAANTGADGKIADVTTEDVSA